MQSWSIFAKSTEYFSSYGAFFQLRPGVPKIGKCSLSLSGMLPTLTAGIHKSGRILMPLFRLPAAGTRLTCLRTCQRLWQAGSPAAVLHVVFRRHRVQSGGLLSGKSSSAYQGAYVIALTTSSTHIFINLVALKQDDFCTALVYQRAIYDSSRESLNLSCDICHAIEETVVAYVNLPTGSLLLKRFIYMDIPDSTNVHPWPSGYSSFPADNDPRTAAGNGGLNTLVREIQECIENGTILTLPQTHTIMIFKSSCRYERDNFYSDGVYTLEFRFTCNSEAVIFGLVGQPQCASLVNTHNKIDFFKKGFVEGILPRKLEDEWREWVLLGTPDEKRDLAFDRLQACYQTQSGLLDLSELGLTSLPDSLPTHIEELRVKKNRLEIMPSLTGLTALRVANFSHNCLTTLTIEGHPLLDTLTVSHNKLTKAKLIDMSSLTMLILHHNELTSLTMIALNNLFLLKAGFNRLVILFLTDLPALNVVELFNNHLTGLFVSALPKLQSLYVYDNLIEELQLNDVPLLENLLINNNKLSRLIMVRHINLQRLEARGNPLKEVLLKLLPVLEKADFLDNMPFRLIKDDVNPWADILFPPIYLPCKLADTHPVAMWFTRARQPTALAQWTVFLNEVGGTQLCRLLIRLGENLTAKQPGFRRYVMNCLDIMATDPRVRAAVFTIAIDESCHSTILCWSRIQTAVMLHRLQDLRPEVFIRRALQTFRIEKLGIIASEKVAEARTQSRTSDEVEVMLIYQAKLKEELALPGEVIPEVPLNNLINISPEDITAACRRVRQEEMTTFFEWLCRCKPCQAYVQRGMTINERTALEKYYLKTYHAHDELHQHKKNTVQSDVLPESGPDVSDQTDYEVFGPLIRLTFGDLPYRLVSDRG